jgi:hypothetical protein
MQQVEGDQVHATWVSSRVSLHQSINQWPLAGAGAKRAPKIITAKGTAGLSSSSKADEDSTPAVLMQRQWMQSIFL